MFPAIINGINAPKGAGRSPVKYETMLGIKAITIACLNPSNAVAIKNKALTIVPVMNWFFIMDAKSIIPTINEN